MCERSCPQTWASKAGPSHPCNRRSSNQEVGDSPQSSQVIPARPRRRLPKTPVPDFVQSSSYYNQHESTFTYSPVYLRPPTDEYRFPRRPRLVTDISDTHALVQLPPRTPPQWRRATFVNASPEEFECEELKSPSVFRRFLARARRFFSKRNFNIFRSSK